MLPEIAEKYQLIKPSRKEISRSTLSTWVISLFLTGIMVSAAYFWWQYESEFPRTDDAKLAADFVWITPRVSGQVTAVLARPDHAVKAGEILFKIDTRQSIAPLDQPKEKAELEHAGRGQPRKV